MLNRTFLPVFVGVAMSVMLAASDAGAQHRGGAMGRAAERAAAPRAGVTPAVPRTFSPDVRVGPRIVTGYPYRPFSRPFYRPYYRSYYRPYYPYYRPGFSLGFSTGYPAYGY